VTRPGKPADEMPIPPINMEKPVSINSKTILIGENAQS
jgi:hypothetical protein